MSNRITRKKFIQRLAVSAGVGMVATLPGVKMLEHRRDKKADKDGAVKISPVSGGQYPESTLKFMSEARFKNARHAIHGMGNQNIEFFLEHV